MLALRRSLAGSAFGVAVLLLAAIPSARASHDPAHPLAGEWKLTLPQGGGGLIAFNSVTSAEGQAAVRDNGGPLREGNDPNSASRGEPCPDGSQYYSGTYWTLAGDRGTHAACGSGSSFRGWYHSLGAANFGAYQITVSQGSFQGSFNFPWSEPWAPPPAAQTWSGAFSGHVAGDGASAAAPTEKETPACRAPASAAARAGECVYKIRFAFGIQRADFAPVSAKGFLRGSRLNRLKPAFPERLTRTGDLTDLLPVDERVSTFVSLKTGPKRGAVANIQNATYQKKRNGVKRLTLHFEVETSNISECKRGHVGVLWFDLSRKAKVVSLVCNGNSWRQLEEGKAFGLIRFRVA